MRMTFRSLCSGALLLGLLGFVPQYAQAARGLRMNVIVTPRSAVMQIRIRHGAFVRLQQRRLVVQAHLWMRDATGWHMIGNHQVNKRRWVTTVSKRRVCGRSFGRKRVALQVGVRYRRWWRNRYTRSWQRRFVSVKQRIVDFNCGTMPNDMPPGSPAGARPPRLDAPLFVPNLPGQRPAAQPQPTQPPPGHHPGNHPGHHPGHHPPAQPPVQPPPPQVVPSATARSFIAALRSASFDKNRVRMVRSWVRRLGPNRVRPRHIRRMLKAFSFDRDRLKAARALSRGALRPIRAAQVVRMIRPFSFDRQRAKAAMYFCRGLADPLNVEVITKAFSFNSYKNQIRAACR